MPDSKPFKTKPSSWHISVAAGAIAAGQFARCGYDVSVQYGADQPEYDLVIAKGNSLLKVSVKGSQDWGWGLTQSYLEKATAKSGNVSLEQLPRLYLATPKEVAEWLHASAKGGVEIRFCVKEHTWAKNAYAAGTVDIIPANWKFSEERIHELIKSSEAGFRVERATPSATA